MHGEVSPAFTLALAMAAGVVASAVAMHLRVPSIVLLFATGIVLGPDVLNVIRPGDLGGALPAIVGFAAAVVLFEGGMHLELNRLRRVASVIRRMVFVGGLLTGVGGTLAARFFMGWDWGLSAVFGALVVVTGPTVIAPILRRVPVSRNVETVLEAEGLFVDAIGAILAVAALEMLLSGPTGSAAAGLMSFASRFALGVGVGIVGGLVLVLLLKVRRLVPLGLENVLALAVAVLVFQASNALLEESGIAAAISAGMVTGNARLRGMAELREFKGQLTVLLIAILFVLLAADVRVASVLALGWPGLLTVGAIIFVVRPIAVAASTARSGLSLGEKAFLSWLAPRGIVAAAVSSLFADALDAAGIPGGEAFRGLVFLVISITVVLQGLSAGPVATLLRVRRPMGVGHALLGANELARALATALQRGGEPVVLIDNNPDTCRAAEEAGFTVVYGNGIDETVLAQARIAERATCIGVTPNDEINLLFLRAARDLARAPAMYAALESDTDTVTPRLVRSFDGHVLFARPADLDNWLNRLRQGAAHVETWRLDAPLSPEPEAVSGMPPRTLLPLTVRSRGRTWPMSERVRPRVGDQVDFVVIDDAQEVARAWLQGQGWRPVT